MFYPTDSLNNRHAQITTESIQETITQSPPRQKLGTARGRSVQSGRIGVRDTFRPAKTHHLRSIRRRGSRQSRWWRWRSAHAASWSRWTRNVTGRYFQRLFRWGHARWNEWHAGRDALLFDGIWWTGCAFSGWRSTAKATRTAAATTTGATTTWLGRAFATASSLGDFAAFLLCAIGSFRFDYNAWREPIFQFSGKFWRDCADGLD